MGASCILLVTLLITRELGADAMAHYALFLAAASVLSVLLPFGFQAFGAMISAEYRAHGQTGLIRSFARHGQKIIVWTALILTPAFALAGIFIPTQTPYDLATTAWFIIPAAMPMALLYFNGSILVGLEKQYQGQLPDTFLRPVLLLSGIIAMLTIFISVSVTQLMFLTCAIFWISALVQFWALNNALALTTKTNDPAADNDEKRKWWRLAPNWMAITLLWDYFVELHMLLAGLLIAPREVALLHICFRIRQLAGFGMRALYALILPKVFAANAYESDAETKSLIRLATRFTLAYAIAVWLGVALVGPYILSAFGEEFKAGLPILLTLLGTLIVRAIFGPAPAVLGMKRKQGLVSRILAVSLVLSLVMAFAGAPLGGVIMIAAAYFAATTFTAIAMWHTAKKTSAINCAVWA